MKGTLSFVAATGLRSRLRQILPDTQANAACNKGPFYEIAIDVERADTPSGFAWTVETDHTDQIYLASMELPLASPFSSVDRFEKAFGQ